MFLCKILPQAGIFFSLGKACLDFDRLSLHFKGGLRLFLQIEVPIGMIVLSPVGFHDEIFPFVEEIRNRNTARQARFPSNRVQDQDGLRAELAADPPLADFDQESINPHEPFDKSIFHCIHSNKYLYDEKVRCT